MPRRLGSISLKMPGSGRVCSPCSGLEIQVQSEGAAEEPHALTRTGMGLLSACTPRALVSTGS